MNEKNSYISAMKLTGVLVIVVGILGSLAMGAVFEVQTLSRYGNFVEKSYNLGLSIGGVVGSLLLGILFLGLGEIIRLLDEIKNSISVGSNTLTTSSQTKTSIDGNYVKDIEENMPKL